MFDGMQDVEYEVQYSHSLMIDGAKARRIGALDLGDATSTAAPWLLPVRQINC